MQVDAMRESYNGYDVLYYQQLTDDKCNTESAYLRRFFVSASVRRNRHFPSFAHAIRQQAA